jgi:hypothetical protein
LVHEIALAKVRGGTDLKTAHNEVRGASEVFSEALVQASLKIDAAIDLLAKYDGSPSLLSIVKELAEKSDILFQTMQRKHDKLVNK